MSVLGHIRREKHVSRGSRVNVRQLTLVFAWLMSRGGGGRFDRNCVSKNTQFHSLGARLITQRFVEPRHSSYIWAHELRVNHNIKRMTCFVVNFAVIPKQTSRFNYLHLGKITTQQRYQINISAWVQLNRQRKTCENRCKFYQSFPHMYLTSWQ